ncbi:MAG TPA: PPE family protein, partial [Mycobacterium sp.]|uniref:PPE family protein n=1 Tax=Mycobacterium sp. TaxID=1785 RepID=UPI002D3B2047
AMPTLGELATNHAVHAVLVATNFFGINTIPIALNEADYVRMWVQAATTMTTYQAVSTTALASTPRTAPAPQIVKSEASTQHSDGAPDPTVDNPIDDLIANFLKNLGINWDPANGTVNGLPYDAYTNPADPMWWVVRALEFFEDFQQFGQDLLTNPAAAFQYLVQLALFDWPTHIAELTGLNPAQQLLAVAIGAALAPAGAVGGFAGLAGLAATQPAAPAGAPLPPPIVPGPAMLPVAGMSAAPAAPAAAPASAPAPAPTPTTSTTASPAPPSAPPAAGGAGFVPPYMVGPPGIGFGSGMSTSASASSSAKKKGSEPDSAAAAAGAAAREQARARRRRRATLRDHGDQFMSMDVDVDPDWGLPEQERVASTAASDAGAGPLGFAGNVRKETTTAAGLTTLSGDEFGEGPAMPMVPGTWAQEEELGPQADNA